jgi:hypothetical protein
LNLKTPSRFAPGGFFVAVAIGASPMAWCGWDVFDEASNTAREARALP